MSDDQPAPKSDSPAPDAHDGTDAHDATAGNPSPLSLSRLREAFAEMLDPQADAASGESGRRLRSAGASTDNRPASDDPPQVVVDDAAAPLPDPCEISPRSVVEAMLFVGYSDNRPLSAREMAAALRGVSPTEIDAAVADLNALYAQHAAPYEIVGTAAGYRLTLRNEYGRMRDKFHGRVREAKLSPAALEVLSVIAYHQPITADAIHGLRGSSSGAALATLVRRKLVRQERLTDPPGPPQYSTTERFLRLFGLESVAALPRSEELEAA